MNAICIASGPSLTQTDIDKCRLSGRTVYVVNDVFKSVPWAGYLFAADGDWWDHHKGAQGFAGERWTINNQMADKWGLNHIEGTSSGLFSATEPICYGKHSGFQAIGLAAVHGHKDIWLLGYDLGFEPGTPKHFFGEHPRGVDRPSQYGDWIEHFNRAAPLIAEAGIKIINMTRKTALECFERGSL